MDITDQGLRTMRRSSPTTLSSAGEPDALGETGAATPDGTPSTALDYHRLTITVVQAGALLGIGRSAAYEAIRRGDIPCIRIGRRIIVPLRALDKLLETAGPLRENGAAE